MDGRALPPPQGPPFIGIAPPASLLRVRPVGTVTLSPLVIVSVLAQAVLATLVWLLVLASAPRLLGSHPVVITGGSMQPSLSRGDVVIVRSAGSAPLRPGMVITFADPNRPSTLVTHRVRAVGADGQLVTKGDANRQEDGSPVPLAAVRGRVALRVPFIGAPVVWVQHHQWYQLAAAMAALAGLVMIAIAPSREART